VKPPTPTYVENGYLTDPGYQGPQPTAYSTTTVRDVPDWYKTGTAPANPVDPSILKWVIPSITNVSEKVGPIDPNRFWVAPFTDAHLFRFPDKYDPFPPTPPQNPYVPPGPPPTTPLPPPSPTDPSSVFVDQFPFLTMPFNWMTQALNSILYSIKYGYSITPGQRALLDTYVFALDRLAGLARCSRILLQTEGQLFLGRKKDDSDSVPSSYVPYSTPISPEVNLYLVMNPPRPVLMLPRGINKVLLGRPKMTSYMGTDFFVTAALTYRYPAVATVSLCAGNPQVDFLIQCPSDKFEEYRRMGLLPESQTPQHSPPVVGGTILIPAGYGTSLVDVLSNMTFW